MEYLQNKNPTNITTVTCLVHKRHTRLSPGNLGRDYRTPSPLVTILALTFTHLFTLVALQSSLISGTKYCITPICLVYNSIIVNGNRLILFTEWYQSNFLHTLNHRRHSIQYMYLHTISKNKSEPLPLYFRMKDFWLFLNVILSQRALLCNRS